MMRYCVIVAVLLIYSHSTNAAASFNDDMGKIERHLRAEKTGKFQFIFQFYLFNFLDCITNSFIYFCSHLAALFASFHETTGKLNNENIDYIFPSRERLLCDVLNNDKKQSICDEIMQYLVYKEHNDEFLSFVDTDLELPIPRMVNSMDPYECQGTRIEKLNMAKPMFWCRSKYFHKKMTAEEIERQHNERPRGIDSLDTYGAMKGFFCAGSRTIPGRVYAFRARTSFDRAVDPVVEMNDVDSILEYDPYNIVGSSNLDSASTSSLSVASASESGMIH